MVAKRTVYSIMVMISSVAVLVVKPTPVGSRSISTLKKYLQNYRVLYIVVFYTGRSKCGFFLESPNFTHALIYHCNISIITSFIERKNNQSSCEARSRSPDKTPSTIMLTEFNTELKVIKTYF